MWIIELSKEQNLIKRLLFTVNSFFMHLFVISGNQAVPALLISQLTTVFLNSYCQIWPC